MVSVPAENTMLVTPLFTCSLIDQRRQRFLLIHSSLLNMHHSATERLWSLRLSNSFEWHSTGGARASSSRAWKPKESPLAWRRKPQETSDRPWRRKSDRRSKCVWCVCVMTRSQVAQSNQNKTAKLPRTSLSFIKVCSCWYQLRAQLFPYWGHSLILE